MTTERDPLVARALEQLVAGAERDPDEIIRLARVDARTLQQRQTVRLRRVAVIALAALLLLAGAAIAASRFDAFPFFDRSDRSAATFSIDPSRQYRGAAPDALVCPQARVGSFECSAGSFSSKNRRTYQLADRVETVPTVSRRFYLDALDKAEREHRMDHATAEKLRRDVAQVGDDFFSALSSMSGIVTIAGGEQAPGKPGYVLVPPRGVPMWIACEAAGSTFRCRSLASARNVAVGTPLYFLRSSSDWVAVPHKAGTAPDNVDRFFHAALGRGLRPAEVRLLYELAAVDTTEHSGSGGAGQISPPRRSH